LTTAVEITGHGRRHFSPIHLTVYIQRCNVCMYGQASMCLLFDIAVKSIDWDTWFYSPGMPPVKNNYDTSLATAAYDLAVQWHTADVMGIGAEAPSGASASDIESWGSEQVLAVHITTMIIQCDHHLAVLCIAEIQTPGQLLIISHKQCGSFLAILWQQRLTQQLRHPDQC